MTLALHYLAAISTHARLLVPILAVAWLLGELPARYCGLGILLARGTRLLAFLRRKLDRPQRGIATLVYRGMVAALCVLAPSIGAGLLLARPHPACSALSLLLLFLLCGRAFNSIALFRRWRRARTRTLPLEVPGGDFLFADTHAVLRSTILDSSESFAIGIVGAGFWYLLGGLPLMLPYLALAAAARAFRTPAFGWAANALFHLVDAMPRLLAALLLTLAACFTPRTHPLAVLHARTWPGTIAHLLGIALGGPLPARTLPWVGTGTPKPTAAHLLSWLVLRSIATLLFLMLLAAMNYHNLLK